MAIRKAIISDIPAILSLIHQLAEYENASEQVVATEADLERSFFGENPQVFCHVATHGDEVVAIAIWYLNYSTWLGKHGLYLEDLFVIPSMRGQGYGISLLQKLAEICIENDYERFQWWVLDWNLPSIKFYESLGAEAMDEWTTFRLTGDSLRKLSNMDL